MTVALVTGAARGIGQAIAVALAGDGFDVGLGFATGEVIHVDGGLHLHRV